MPETLATPATRLHFSDEFPALMQRLDQITPMLKQNSEKNEEQRDLTAETVQALHNTGVFKVGLPQSLGGYEFSPRQVVDTIAKLAYADASTGWTFMALQMITGTTAAYLDATATQDLFPDVANDNYALIAGQGSKLGTAVQVDGGYLVSGHWLFASGISLASHIHAAALCEQTGQAIVVTFPRDAATLVDNWDVMGLRATSSIDYICNEVFVPDTHFYDIATMHPRNGGAIYKMGLANMSGICHTGWALGVGRRMLDEMRALAGRKTGTPGTSVDTHQFYAEYAQAEAKLRSAYAWAMDVWSDNEAILDSGDLLDTEQETVTRLMLNNTTWSAHAVGQTVYKWAATAALRSGDLQRYFRDLHAGTQHVTSGPVVLQNCGKWLSGLAPNGEWVFLELQELS